MPLKGIFNRHIHKSSSPQPPSPPSPPSPPTTSTTPKIKLIRSDTVSETLINPPTGFSDEDLPAPTSPTSPTSLTSLTSPTSPTLSADIALRPRASSSARLRESFHFGHHRARSSSNVPADLPAVDDTASNREEQWEKRATVLVGTQTPRSRNGSIVGIDKDTDESIQQAIKLHEAGDYARSTQIFGRLADPDGVNNPLSQVLYGLALRHGWGVKVDTERAVTFLKAAAKNSAGVEQEALRLGTTGNAKGELVLAIYELGNSYRQGWGVEKDPVAAREYYETAANLGDSDAQNEVGWCYLEGFGCRKDKNKSARFYRMAEKQGNKTIGNSWIYKPKYLEGEKK